MTRHLLLTLLAAAATIGLPPAAHAAETAASATMGPVTGFIVQLRSATAGETTTERRDRKSVV